MPVTKTAKRALRSSKKKAKVNSLVLKGLEIALRKAKKTKKDADVLKATSLADRAAKNKTIHQNKASHIKSALNKLLIKKEKPTKKSSAKKS